MNEYCAVVGAGTMGLGIAYVLAAAGDTVILVEPDESRRDAAEKTLAEVARDAVSRGKLQRREAEALLSRLRTAPAVVELPTDGAALVVEAVPERVELKHLVLREIEDRCAPAILASNTSGLSIATLADCLAEPGRFLGLHFFNPVWVMSLLEVVRGPRTAPGVVEAAVHLAVRIGKQPILVNDSPGFASSRLGVCIGLEAMRMFGDGIASAEDIDQAMELGYRHPMGPLKLTDLVGLDVRLDIARHLESTLGPRFAPPQVLVDKVAAGELGKKSGVGFYDWR
jgi:3-hydroxybutyryl-CoA dehydrogenase